MSDRRRSLWRHRDFRLLWAGQTVSELGSQVSVLAVPLVAIDTLHAGTFEVGLLTSLATVPFLIVGLPAGAWVDRWPKRPVLLAADALRAITLATIPLAWWLSALTMGQLYAVTLISGTLTVFFDVAYRSYLPVLVERDELVDGNGKLAATMAGAQVGGPAVGGSLVAAVGAAPAVLADALSFVVSCGSLLAVRVAEPRPERRPRQRGGLRGEIGEGLHFVWREPRIRSVAASTATSNLFSTMGLAVLLVFLRRDLHVGPARIGLLMAVGGTGGLLGAVIAGPLARRLGLGRAILWAMAFGGIGQLGYPLATARTATALVIASGFVLSAGAIAFNINQLSLRQALCPFALQGRMNASVRFMVWGTMPVGGFAGGVLGAWIGLRPTLWVAGAGALTAFLWIAFSPLPGVRTMPSSEDDAALAWAGQVASAAPSSAL
mgnify:CR=1 FL=1